MLNIIFIMNLSKAIFETFISLFQALVRSVDYNYNFYKYHWFYYYNFN